MDTKAEKWDSEKEWKRLKKDLRKMKKESEKMWSDLRKKMMADAAKI